MPIFQDDLASRRSTPPTDSAFAFPISPSDRTLRRRASEESIRTELCEGPILESPADDGLNPAAQYDATEHETSSSVSDRVELIARLKRGESPTWVPNRHLESMFFDYGTRILARRPMPEPALSPPLLPAAEIKTSSHNSSPTEDEALQAGLAIERPRSALHSGDFTEESPEERRPSQQDEGSKVFNPRQLPWLSTSPPRDFTPFRRDLSFATSFPDAGEEQRSRAPSLSSSFSSSFVYKPPTSPLVQSESNDELDFSPILAPFDATFQRNAHRHTFQTSRSLSSTPSMLSALDYGRPVPELRRDNTYPYQAHQPRRSMTSHAESNPQTPALLRSRRPSFASDSSPLQHASMVGSYEESILRGRMSTTPSRPLDFVAQIGVLGLGKCKSSLRCPAHVSLPFPAVFYSYATTTHGRVKAEDGPSPYVGQIDLENGLPHLDDGHETRRKRRNETPERRGSQDIKMSDASTAATFAERDMRRAQKHKRRSTSPKAPPGGSYRIPEKGQLQIIIKNPNKTAVKLFLVPYDLAGMEPGTKTFIRQRIYSAGPIIESPLSSSLQKTSLDASGDRSTLRYLVHLNICSPSRGRFYLYKTIRVVFANRVPDGKEKLQNQIQMPEPRFSVYKPSRDSNGGFNHGSGAGASLAAEKAFRRRSSGFPLSPSHRAFDAMDGVAQSLQASIAGGEPYPHGNDFSIAPVEPIPFSLFKQQPRSQNIEIQLQSPTSSKSSRGPASQDSGMSGSWSSSAGVGGYDKLNKGDVGYGGNAFAGTHNGHQAPPEGLLAQKLKCLGVGKQSQEPSTGYDSKNGVLDDYNRQA